MTKSEFLGKRVNFERLKDIFYRETNAGDVHYKVFLKDYDFEHADQKSGMNFFSLVLRVDGDKLADIKKIGHSHMCSGEGTDSDLRAFPFSSLEREAKLILSDVVE
jgi:hypothetical protein